MKNTRQGDLEDADVETVNGGGGGEGEVFRMNTCTLVFFTDDCNGFLGVILL